jgi:hypothetical protein
VSGKFLHSLFKMCEFPPAVVPDIVARYSTSYARDLAFNHSLGDSGSALVPRAVCGPGDAIVELISAGSHAVLDAVLDSKENRYGVLRQILTTWKLCPNDQRRFLDRELISSTFDLIFEIDWCFSYDVIEDGAALQLERGAGLVIRRRPACCVAGGNSPRVTSLIHQWAPWGKTFDAWSTPGGSLGTLVSDFGNYTDSNLGYVRCAGQVIREHLGEGESAASLRAWLLFLGLAGSDPPVRLKSVIKSACVLARAE